MAKRGRPRKEINRKTFEELCAIQCTKNEIAGVLGVDDNTIDRWCKREYKLTFSEVYNDFAARGKMSLRRSQFKLAQKSAAMAIFLGKQMLGKKDHIQYEDREAVDVLKAILLQNRENAKLQLEQETK